jgi:hypothetical protein
VGFSTRGFETGIAAMTSTVGSVGTTQGAPLAPVVSTPVASLKATASLAPKTPAVTSLQNPRIVFDPSAGLITEYLSANGSQIISQTPGAITVAYLRLGLTAEGQSKQPSVPVAQHIGTTA